MGKRKLTHGGLEKVCAETGYSRGRVECIIISGGVGLTDRGRRCYDFLWEHRKDLFTREYVKIFERNDKRNKK